jgi:DNA-binding NarL/FixJ family response regulator
MRISSQEPCLTTRRQAQILELAAHGLADKEIARQLGVSISTIRTQVKRFYSVNSVHNRAGAVGLWLRANGTGS